ncbi:Pr6Pr family membrane protein [Sphingomonas rhizophila]|uniref:Pr6Pr family membrane protein n=2 Tax=Sphingomonas rhizophila TaxID=2071607 RepID=A0A7G9SEN7_9SPHN|nr:Pr6Pr family membrane protein [Sphingomonas rhizophila]
MGVASNGARLAAVLVAAVAWIGIAVQFRATLGQGYDIGATLWILLRYFTILTNLALAVMMTMVALGRRVSPAWLGGVTLAMVLVGVVYMTLLRGLLDLSGGALLADTLLHKVTPILSALWWLLLAPKGRLGRRAPLLWALYPLVYFGYALWRGSIEGVFAYPFINYANIGVPAVALNAVVIAGCFLLAGLSMVAIDRRLGASRAAG